jgi:hypothetical protein
MVRVLLLVCMTAVLAGGCSLFNRDVPMAPAAPGSLSSEEVLKRNCADPQWREENLGLWYSVCRQPARW